MTDKDHKGIFLNIVATGTGLILGVVTILGMELLESNLYPLPANYAENPNLLQAYFTDAPTWLKIIELVTWAVGSFAGSMIAAFLSRSNKLGQALLVGSLLMVTGILFMEIFQHPLWYWIGSLVAFLPFSYLGGTFGIKLSKKVE